MVDTPTLTALIGGGVLVLTAIGTSFWNAFFSKSGSISNDLRDALADDVNALRAELRALRTEQEHMRMELDGLRIRNSRLFGERETARLKLRMLEQRHGEPVTGWEPDPTTGGSP
jgi:hypothetical protein